MDKRNFTPHPFEPTAGELPPGPDNHFTINRRKFFKLTGGGLVVAFVLHDVITVAGEHRAGNPMPLPASQVSAWIHIGENGKVSVFTGKVEVGQNIRTSLSQVVAEELKVPLSSIEMIMGDTDRVPYDAGTFGSRTTPQMGSQLRKASATAREALLQMAAKNWEVPLTGLVAKDGMVVHAAGNKKLSYGEITKGKQLLLPVAEDGKVTVPGEWEVAGKTVPKVNGRSFITGSHPYVSDMKLPGMLYGKVLRAPSYKAKLVNADISRAKAMPGVVVVKDGDFVAVAAPDVHTAEKALLLIDARWDETAGQPSNATIFDYLVQQASGGTEAAITKSDVTAGLAAADIKHSQTYNIHYIAHVPLEPRAALARWDEGKLTAWTGTQRPFGVQEELARIFKIPKEKVRVLMPDTGSGYGGKHSGEAAVEAARLAQEVGKPVKVVWTRAEEFNWAYFRPGGVVKVDSGVNNNGNITAWKFINYNSGGAGLATQYRVMNQQTDYISSASPLKQGSYRGLATTANVFARECHMTDLARLLKMDQLDFRLKNLDDARLIAVLQAAAKGFGWKNHKATGHGYGIAGGFEKGGYVGTCAEVMVNSDKEVKVLRVTQAFECGAIIHPHHLEQQVMGSIVQGLGGALFEKVEFANGQVLNSGLAAYRVPRFSDMPKINIILLDRKDLPSAGAGEAAIIGIAPAIRNAILDATGAGLFTLPMLPNGVLP